MSKGVSTAGMTLNYIIAAEGSIPSTGTVTKIPEVKTMPSFNNAPEGIDITPLDELVAVQYTAGLKDLGGVLEFGANCTDELITAWNTTLLTAFGSMASGNVCWFEVKHPKIAEAVWFIGEPVELSINEASVGSALETTLYIAPKSAPKFGDKL